MVETAQALAELGKSKTIVLVGSLFPARFRETDAEFNILGVVWQRGRVTVREVHDELEGRLGIGYTTVLKLMQIMTDKGALVRDESVRPQVYRVAQARSKTQKQLVADLRYFAEDGRGSMATIARRLAQSKSN